MRDDIPKIPEGNSPDTDASSAPVVHDLELPEGFVDLSEPQPGEPEGLRDKVIAAIRTVFDPEIPVNVYELGLIYDLKIDADGKADIIMTLTSPACPVAGSLPGDVEVKVKGAEGITDATVGLTWDPPWSMERLSEVARLELGM